MANNEVDKLLELIDKTVEEADLTHDFGKDGEGTCPCGLNLDQTDMDSAWCDIALKNLLRDFAIKVKTL